MNYPVLFLSRIQVLFEFITSKSLISPLFLFSPRLPMHPSSNLLASVSFYAQRTGLTRIPKPPDLQLGIPCSVSETPPSYWALLKHIKLSLKFPLQQHWFQYFKPDAWNLCSFTQFLLMDCDLKYGKWYLI